MNRTPTLRGEFPALPAGRHHTIKSNYIMMNSQNKTKDEFIKELQKLQKEYDTLKTSYEKDITESKKVEASLKQALEWKEAIFEGSRDAIFISDKDSRFVAVNNTACDLTGYSREQLLKMRIPDIHDLPDLDAYKMYHKRIFGGEEILSEAKILRCYGAKIDTEFNNRCVSIAGKLYMHTTARDITGRKQVEESMEKLNHRLDEIRENERALISREIHDQLGQSLTALKIDLYWLRRQIVRDSEESTKVEGMIELVTGTIRDVQRISSELRPPILDDLGLAAAVEWYCEEFANRTGLKVQMEI